MQSGEWITSNSKKLTCVSDAIWNYAETALGEHRSAGLLTDCLREAGFTIRANLSGMPTAFHAVWGRGNPRIGFLGEYDALPRLSQKAVPHIEKRGESENGHGCGHNLLGVGSMAAAISLRYAMERENRKGRVEFFGCPAEETMTGKIRMVADGAFDGLDAALTWHPAYFNGVMEESLLAMKSMRYTFSGLSSHAASAPERGKSALDAVELMNVGVNYLREHVTDDVRIHYTITDGGGEPNIVPARAQSLYYVRAAKRRTVEETVARIGEIAEGAALMTGASCYSEPLQGCSQFLHNGVLEELLYDCLLDTPLQAWTPEDRDFASRLVESLEPETLRSVRGGRSDLFGDRDVLHTGVAALTKTHPKAFVSTDVSEVSWTVPVAQLWSCCAPIGVAHHTWQFTASAGTGIGHRGMLYAAKTLAEAGWRLASDEGLAERTKEDFLSGKTRQD